MFFKSKPHPLRRYSYAVTTGTYVGEILVYIKSTTECHVFLTIPKLQKREIPIDKFDLGLSDKIVEVVEKLPRDVYKVCVAQYNKSYK